MFSRIKKLLTKHPKTVLSLAVILTAAAVFVPIVASAGYGPNRATYDWNKYDPSVSCTDPTNAYGQCGSMTGPVFDSFVNTPSYGDEENFNTVAPVVSGQSPTDASYSDTTTATPGQQYWVRTLVHNDANQNLNCLPIHDNTTLNDCTQVDPGSPSIATGTTFHLAIAPGTANGVDVETYISATNSNPKTIWDTSTLSNPNQAFDVSYVAGSASIYNSAFPNGLPLSDNVNSSAGTPIGYNAMNGVIPGCFNFSSYVYFKVSVQSPALTVQKEVRPVTPASAPWSKTMNANAGDTVQWKISYQDTGTANDNNLTIRDALPKDLSIVPGSVKVYDAANPGGFQLPDTALGSGGVDLGNYAPSASEINGEVLFDTTVNSKPSTCTINNVGYGRADNVPEVSSQASVDVNNCNVPTPAYACTALGVTENGKTVTVNKFNETASGGATFTDAVLDWGDNSQGLTTNNVIGSTHIYSGNGPYTITAVANFKVNGQNVTPTDNGCVTSVSFASTPPTTPPSTTTLPPTQLVNTGPGSVVAIFAGVTAAGAVAFNWLQKKRFAKQ